MRYLVFLPEPPLPATAGGRIANRHLCDGLVARGHDVTVVAIDPTEPRARSVDPWPVERLTLRPDGVAGSVVWRGHLAARRLWHPFASERVGSLRHHLQRAVSRLQPDVVILNHTYGWWPTTRPTVLIAHNIESDRLRAAGAAPRQLKTVSVMERKALRAVDHVAVFSERDRQRARRLEPTADPQVVPLGVSAIAPRRERQPDTLRSVAFIGSFDYAPNVQAAESLASMVPRLRDTGIDRVVLAGRAAHSLPPRTLGMPGVEVHSDVEDMQGLFSKQDLLIVPLSVGGGVRVKILEAWALGVPVVSTAVGIEGLGATHGVDALIAGEPDDLVSLVAEARDPMVRSMIAQGGWNRWSQNYTPAAFAEAIEELANRAFARSASRAKGS